MLDLATNSLVSGVATDWEPGSFIRPHHHRISQLIYAASGVITVETAQGIWVVPPHPSGLGPRLHRAQHQDLRHRPAENPAVRSGHPADRHRKVLRGAGQPTPASGDHPSNGFSGRFWCGQPGGASCFRDCRRDQIRRRRAPPSAHAHRRSRSPGRCGVPRRPLEQTTVRGLGTCRRRKRTNVGAPFPRGNRHELREVAATGALVEGTGDTGRRSISDGGSLRCRIQIAKRFHRHVQVRYGRHPIEVFLILTACAHQSQPTGLRFFRRRGPVRDPPYPPINFSWYNRRGCPDTTSAGEFTYHRHNAETSGPRSDLGPEGAPGMTRNGRRAHGKVLLAACLFSCMATAQGEQEKVPPGSAAAELPALTAAAVDEARRLVQPSNDLRVDALLRALERRSLPYTVQRFPGIGAGDDPRPQGRNVIVTLGAGTPEVIVGAHIDAYRLPSGTLSDAMIDDGAGVVVLLHVADALRNATLRRRVRIVFFDMEETGLVGSRAFVQSLDSAAVAAMINVDVIGNGDTLVYGPQAPSPDGSPAHRVQQACARRGMSCVGMPGMPPGDDLSFVHAGDTDRFARDLVKGRRSPPLVVPPRRPPARPARGARARGPARHSHRTRQRRIAHARRDDAGIPCGNRCAPRHGRGAVLTAERRRSLPEKSAGSSIGNVRLRKSLTPIGMWKQGKRSAL